MIVSFFATAILASHVLQPLKPHRVAAPSKTTVAVVIALLACCAWGGETGAEQAALAQAEQQQQDEDVKNPSLTIETISMQSSEFNRSHRDAPPVALEKSHIVSWQATIDNNLIYSYPEGDAIFRLYDSETHEEFIEVGMGANPDYRFWVAVQTPKEGYIIVHRDTERGWYPQAKTIVSYTERAGMTVNNGARIVVSNLDIGVFTPDAYSAHGNSGTDQPPVAASGEVVVEFLSGDPSQNVFALFPFYVAAGIGVIVGALYLTKRR